MTHPDTLQIPRAVVEQALKKHETNCCMFERGVQTLDDVLASRATFLAALQPQATAEPVCWCTTCRPITMEDMRFVVCPDCGNKRCPKAHNHSLQCTDSNDVGQAGSNWEHIKKDAAEPVGWKHDCAALCMNGVELWIDRCPHCGKPRTTPPTTQAALTAALEALKTAQEALPPYGAIRRELDAAIAQIEALKGPAP